MEHIFELRMKDQLALHYQLSYQALIAQLVEHCTGIAEVMGSNPVQAWIFFRLSFRNCLSCVVTARIFLLVDLSSAVQIYVPYIYIHLFILHGYITNSQYDQLPVGLIAQLVEHCTGIAEVIIIIIIIIIIKSLFILIKNRSANQRIGWYKPVISINIIENLQLVTKIKLKFTNVYKI